MTIKLVGDTFDASSKAAQEYTELKNCTFIDPFDDANVQAGQGTVAYEILEEAKKESIAFDAVLVPVGGEASSPEYPPISRNKRRKSRLLGSKQMGLGR